MIELVKLLLCTYLILDEQLYHLSMEDQLFEFHFQPKGQIDRPKVRDFDHLYWSLPGKL